MKAKLLLACLAALAWAKTVSAQDKAACLDAADKGQTLRNAHKLFEARDKFRVCAAAGCPAVVQGDCAAWLDAVEKALPSVVLAAKSGTGADLFNVSVTMDGQPLSAKLDGQAISIDPGPHSFSFTGSDGTKADQQVLVREGVQSQPVTVVLGQPSPPPAAGAQSAVPQQPVAPAESPRGSSPWRTVGWVAGGVGIVGLAVGSIFGFMAMGDTNNAACNTQNQCKAGPLADARSAALGSDVGLIGGGALLAGGLGLVLFAPRAESAPAAVRVRIGPFGCQSGGGFTAGGIW